LLYVWEKEPSAVGIAINYRLDFPTAGIEEAGASVDGRPEIPDPLILLVISVVYQSSLHSI